MLPPPFEEVGLSLTLPLAVVALAVLLASIRGLARVVRGVDLLAAPLLPRQEVAIAEPGPYSLWIEGPFLARMPPGVGVSLREVSSGIVIQGQRPWLRLKVGGLRRTRRELSRLHLERSGAYELLADGVDAGGAAGASRVIFTRPIRTGSLLLCWLGVWGSAAVLVLAVVSSLFLLQWQESNAPVEQEVPVAEQARAPTAPAARRQQQSGGREILASAALSSEWREVAWKAAGLRFLAPTDWRETANDSQELMLRQPQRRLYLGLRLTRFVAGVPFAQLTAGLDQSAAMQLEAGAIEGWALLSLGPAVGVAEVASQGQVVATWRGFVERGGVPYSLDILIGGGDAGEREDLESIFAAVLDSVRFD